ncbi:hypothetical protein ACFLSU_04305 [Bacteroidota bacterium]
MVFKIRVVLDVKEDVIRTIAIEGNKTLEDLHKTITNVFGFNGQQMASFYRTDDDWNQGEEIPLINMDDSPNALAMNTTTIDQNIEDAGEKLIYVYDFLELWTFFVELIEVTETAEDELPKLILSIGEIPEKAPEKEFKGSKNTDDDDPYGLNEFGDADGFDQFENLDDLDTDIY